MIKLAEHSKDDSLMTVQDVANQLNVSQSMVYGLVERGKLSCFRIGRCLRFTREHVHEFLEQSRSVKEPAGPRRRLKHL